MKERGKFIPCSEAMPSPLICRSRKKNWKESSRKTHEEIPSKEKTKISEEKGWPSHRSIVCVDGCTKLGSVELTTVYFSSCHCTWNIFSRFSIHLLILLRVDVEEYWFDIVKIKKDTHNYYCKIMK